MPRKVGIGEAKQKIGRFCAFRERSPKEVSDKLNSWGLEQDEIEETLNLLLSQNFVDPQRFANAFCNDKFEFNSWGKQKIKMSLHLHRLDSSVLENALESINEIRYFDRLLSLAAKKWESLKNDDELSRKQKTVSYLANKGFEMDLIWKAIHQVSNL